MWPAGEGWIGFGAFGRGAGEVVIARSSRARSMRPKGPFFQNAFRTRASAGSAGRPEYKKIPFCGAFAEPSDGLEPSTPSLPWRSPGGTGVHGRTLEITFFLQIASSRCISRARACPRVPALVYPSRTRGLLSVFKTHN